MAVATLDARLMPLYAAQDRRHAVEQIISDTAASHALTDFAINLVGLVPIPFVGLAAALGAVAIQAPVFYQPMVKKIGAQYMKPPDENTAAIVTDTTWLGAEYDLAVYFGVEFFTDILSEIVTEAGAGWAFSKMIPILGPFLSGGMDAAIAHALTWRVGAAAAAYYENSLRWVGGDRASAYKTAKAWTGKIQDNIGEKRVDLEAIVRSNDEIRSSSRATVLELVRLLRSMSPCPPLNDIRRLLVEEKRIPSDLVDDVLNSV